jgi:transposase
MAKRFRAVDRGQRFLLPVDMTEWLPADHQVWLILDVVEQLDLRVLTGRYALGGVGRRAYDPVMMLALLMYGYANGVRSSRAIERACHTDIAFRVICAQDAPDHTQIARFRRQHLDLFADLFTQVLIVCARLGYVRLGIVAIDGTKIAANASIDATHERDWFLAKVTAMSEEAARLDDAEDIQFGADRRGDEPPDGLSGRGAAGRAERAARLRQCLTELDAEHAARDARSLAQQQQAEEYLRQAHTDTPGMGRPPRGVDPVTIAWLAAARAAARYGPEHRYTRRAAKAAEAKAAHAEAAHAEPSATRATASPAKTGRSHRPRPPQRNSTDPQSRLMPTRKGFIQGYNAQLATSQDHFIIDPDLVQDTSDVEQLQPMLDNAVQRAETLRPHRPDPTAEHATIGTALADNGYCSDANLTAPGPDRLIATGKSRTIHTAATTNPASGTPPDDATPIDRMDHRLRTPDGATLYKQRAATVEPVNGHLKDRIGLRQFLLRGLDACRAELTLAATANNLRHLHNLQHA